jgi:putative endonuclease
MSRSKKPSRAESTRARGAASERRAVWHYRLRGYKILATNAWTGPYELDIVAQRGRQLVFCEVKDKLGDVFGDPFEMVDEEKQRRLRAAAELWLVAHPEVAHCEPRFDVVAVRAGRIERLSHAF